MGLKLVTPPASEPLTLAEAKDHLRVDDTSSDTYITDLIAIARQWAEGETGLALLPQTWAYTTDTFPWQYEQLPQINNPVPYFTPYYAPIILRRTPVVSITSIQYVDSSGNTQTLSSGNYVLNASTSLGEVSPAEIWPVYGLAWPIARPQPAAVTVTFVAGYADAATIPKRIRAAMKLMIEELFRNRGGSVEGAIANVNPYVE